MALGGWGRGNAMNSGKRVSLLRKCCQSGERERERLVLLQRRENATELLRFPTHKYTQGLRLYNKSICSVSNTHSHTLSVSHTRCLLHTAREYMYIQPTLCTYTQLKKTHTEAKYADGGCQNMNQQSQHKQVPGQQKGLLG